MKNLFGSRLLNIGASTLLSGGILSHGGLGGYISDAARRVIGLGLAEFQDGAVHYFSKNSDILKRAVIQFASQTAYGMLRSYPRYIKYWEQKERDKYLETQSQSAIVNKSGQYYQLIKEQQAVAEKKNYTDSIGGRTVADYIELKISGEGTYYDKESGKVEPNSKYGLITFVDLGPQVQLSSKNNIVLTTVQGRDYTRKEFISGGDLEFSRAVEVPENRPVQRCHRLRQHHPAAVENLAAYHSGLLASNRRIPKRAALYLAMRGRGTLRGGRTDLQRCGGRG